MVIDTVIQVIQDLHLNPNIKVDNNIKEEVPVVEEEEVEFKEDGIKEQIIINVADIIVEAKEDDNIKIFCVVKRMAVNVLQAGNDNEIKRFIV